MAWWLLLLLVRVFLPEATLLRLHAHQHTETEVAAPAASPSARKAVLTPQHLHCHTDQLYDVPFQPAEPVQLALLLELPEYARYRPQPTEARTLHLLDGACLRGPPARS